MFSFGLKCSALGALLWLLLNGVATDTNTATSLYASLIPCRLRDAPIGLTTAGERRAAALASCKISAAVCARREAFGQIRTLELRNPARIRRIDETLVFPLRCPTTQNYVEIAQCRGPFKSGALTEPPRGDRIRLEPILVRWLFHSDEFG